MRSALEDYYCTSRRLERQALDAAGAGGDQFLAARADAAQPLPLRRDRGYVCTLSALVLKGRTAHVFHVGDTRIYRAARGDALEQLTEDHRVWLGGGQSLPRPRARLRVAARNRLPRLPLERGDLFVLASDGVLRTPRGAPRAWRAGASTATTCEAAARRWWRRRWRAAATTTPACSCCASTQLPEAAADEARQLRAGLPLPPLLQARAGCSTATASSASCMPATAATCTWPPKSTAATRWC